MLIHTSSIQFTVKQQQQQHTNKTNKQQQQQQTNKKQHGGARWSPSPMTSSLYWEAVDAGGEDVPEGVSRATRSPPLGLDDVLWPNETVISNVMNT